MNRQSSIICLMMFLLISCSRENAPLAPVGAVTEIPTYFKILDAGDTSFAYIALQKRSDVYSSIDLHIKGDSLEWNAVYFDSSNIQFDQMGWQTTDWSNYSSFPTDAKGFHFTEINYKNNFPVFDSTYYGKYSCRCTINKIGSSNTVVVRFEGIH